MEMATFRGFSESCVRKMKSSVKRPLSQTFPDGCIVETTGGSHLWEIEHKKPVWRLPPVFIEMRSMLTIIGWIDDPDYCGFIVIAASGRRYMKKCTASAYNIKYEWRRLA